MVDDDLHPLPKSEIVAQLRLFPGWKFESDKLIKQFEFSSFSDAVLYINGLVGYCNYLDHHPDININYKKIIFELTRYSAGGKVTTRDFTVAKKIDDDYLHYITRKIK